ncbi:MAG: hypothetical protein ACLQGU_02520 [bacterium]
MTTLLTVVSGALVFIIGQIAIKFFLDPINEQSKVMRQIISSMIFHGDLISNPGPEPADKRMQLCELLRHQAGDLSASTNGIPWYNFWESIGLVPKRDRILSVCSALIGLSNSVFGTADKEGIRLWKQHILIGLSRKGKP